MHVTQQHMPQHGEQIGDERHNSLWGSETTTCQILLESGLSVLPGPVEDDGCATIGREEYGDDAADPNWREDGDDLCDAWGGWTRACALSRRVDG